MNFDFEAFYRADRDPWNFATSDYERGRYQATLAALPRAHYAQAFEPGCSIGELTAQLARRCDKVIAIDIAPSAVTVARQRCAGLDNVDITCGDIAVDIPHGPFDLIVMSEIGYYFSIPQLHEIGMALAGRLTNGGDLIAVHWLGSSADHVLHGDLVHGELLAVLPLQWQAGHRHGQFRIDRWRRP